MKILNASEELELITELTKLSLIPDCGSSRAVIDLPYDVQKRLFDAWNIKVDPLASYVVKVAIGVGGYTQAMNEISTYTQFANTGFLATIVAYGQYCEIMEKVEIYYDGELGNFCPFEGDLMDSPYMWLIRRDGKRVFWTALKEKGLTDIDDYDDFLNEIEDDSNALPLYYEKYWRIFPDEKETDLYFMSEVSKFIEVYSSLNEMLGSSDDNSQIGKDHTSKYVCFDYGYRRDSWGDSFTWSSPACEYLCENEEEFGHYLEYLVKTLKETKQFETLLNKESHSILHRRINEIKWLEEQGYEDSAESLRRNTRESKLFSDCEEVSEI